MADPDPIVIVLTTTGGPFDWVTPEDWDNDANTFELIGGGAGGGTLSSGAGGGGGGGYLKFENLDVAAETTLSYQIGVGGSAGNAGGDTFFSTPLGDFTARGGATASGGTGGAGGSGDTDIEGASPTVFDGGNGGSQDTQGGGGGGAGGPTGNGLNGGDAGASLGGDGGDGSGGDGGAGGAGGSGSVGGADGSDGSNMVDDPVVGSGGGGGGAGNQTASSAGNGGLYGAGGGGRSIGTATNAGIGAQGVIVITYIPKTGESAIGNMSAQASTTSGYAVRKAPVDSDVTVSASVTLSGFKRSFATSTITASTDIAGYLQAKVPFTAEVSAAANIAADYVHKVHLSTEAFADATASLDAVRWKLINATATATANQQTHIGRVSVFEGNLDAHAEATGQITNIARPSQQLTSIASTAGAFVRFRHVTSQQLIQAVVSVPALKQNHAAVLHATALATVGAEVFIFNVRSDITATATATALPMTGSIHVVGDPLAQAQTAAQLSKHFSVSSDAQGIAQVAGEATKHRQVTGTITAQAVSALDAVREVTVNGDLFAEANVQADAYAATPVSAAAQAASQTTANAVRRVMGTTALEALALSAAEIHRTLKIAADTEGVAISHMTPIVAQQRPMVGGAVAAALGELNASQIMAMRGESTALASIRAIQRGTLGIKAPEPRRRYIRVEIRKVIV